MKKANLYDILLLFIISIMAVGCSLNVTQNKFSETIQSQTNEIAVSTSKPAYLEGSMILKNGRYVADTTDTPIILKYNPECHDPTWTEVLKFLSADNTDAHPYYPDKYVCANYAAQFYENAQKGGLRCAYVVLNGINHALNAFNTTDKGFIYVDFTGKQYNPKFAFNGVLNYKKIAYVQDGNGYGLISLDTVISNNYGFDYPTFIDWHAKAIVFENTLQDYNTDVNQYNAFIKDKVFTYGSEDYEKANSWQRTLELTRTKLLDDTKLIGPVWDFSEYGNVTMSEVFWKGYGQED
jgi:hypothetical protein